MSKPVVAIVGRPNTGKSTLFNRALGQPVAITADEPGTTRDRIFATVEWAGRSFILADTAGLEAAPRGTMQRAVQAQVQAAIDAADAIIFLTDAASGITSADADVADALRGCGKPVVLAVNKADNPERALASAEFYALGMGEPLAISAYHNRGLVALWDRVAGQLPEPSADEPEAGLRLAIVGRPNTGKSSLVNALLGQERMVVHEAPGTTRDSIDSIMESDGQQVLLIDTAGIRRRGKIGTGLERYSVLRALRAVERCSIAILVLDAQDLGAAQDAHVAGFVLDAGKGLVLAINKWDLAAEMDLSSERAEGVVRGLFRFAPFAPLVFISALKHQGLPELLRTASEVYRQRYLRVSDKDLDRALEQAAGENLPRLVGKRRLHIFHATQSQVDPPTFTMFVNDPKLLHFSYQRYLENRLREHFGFAGTPLKLIFKVRGEA